MALESASFISDLVATNPEAGDNVTAGDDHIRLLKAALLASFPGVTGAVTSTHTELNLLDGLSASTAELNILDGVTATASELNILDGVTATTAEINYLSGVTSGIQAQINAVSSAPAGGWVLLKSTAASTSATVDFVNGTAGVVIDSTYDEYMVAMIAVLPATDGASLVMRTSTNAGSSYDTTGSYDYVNQVIDGTPTTGAAATFIALGVAPGNASGEQGFYGQLFFYVPASAAKFHAHWTGAFYQSNGVIAFVKGAGTNVNAANVDAIRFLFGSGNITSGTFNLYGRRKS